MDYYLGTQPVKGFPLLLRMTPEGAIYKFDFTTKQWTLSNKYSSIFIGEPEVDHITEEKANDVINNN